MLRSTIIPFIALGLVAQTPAPEVKPAPAPAAKQAPATPAPAATAGKPAPAAPAAAKPAAEPPKEDKLLAKIDGVEIHESDMDTMYESLAPQQRASMQGQGKDKMVQNYLEFRILVAKSHRLGLDKTPEYQKKLKLSSYQLMAAELLRKESENLQKRTTLSDAELKGYFEANQESFKTPGKFSARHILIKTKGGQNGDQGLSEEEALKKANEIKAEFDKGGKWDDLAKKYSEDPGSKDKGGLYEGIAFGQFVPEFEVAVKKQEIGKIGEPVKSMFGFHLIEVVNRGDSAAPVFDAVKEQVRQKAAQAKQEAVWKEFIEELRKEVVVTEGGAVDKQAKPAPAAKKPAAVKPAAKKTEGASK
jgi:parvulin-like peptidyl-prolyl isomerase